jgi:hypothetical protein
LKTHVESILENEEASDLPGDSGDGGEGDGVGRHAKVLGHRMETPDLDKETESRQLYSLTRTIKDERTDLRKLNSKVRKENKLGAVPLLLRGGDLALHHPKRSKEQQRMTSVD